MTFRNERDPKNTTTSLSLVKKKTEERSFMKRKNASDFSSLFFRSKFIFREKHTTHEKRGQTKERREQNARKSWPPLSPPLRFYRCVPFRRRLRLVGERGGEGAKEAPIIIR
jgi:hypothetical protein